MPDALPPRREAKFGIPRVRILARVFNRLDARRLSGPLKLGLRSSVSSGRSIRLALPLPRLLTLAGRLPGKLGAAIVAASQKPTPASPESGGMVPTRETFALFYATERGREVARQVSRTIRRLTTESRTGTTVIGLGYAIPYFSCWLRVRGMEVIEGVDADRYGGQADLVLVAHALEFAADPRGLLRGAWQMLADHGRLVVVVPHRGGPLAHLRSTPFGLGRTWRIGELDQLLAANLFRTERRRLAVAMPSARPRLSAIGDPLLGGVIVAVAIKDVYAGLPLQPARAGSLRRRVLMQA